MKEFIQYREALISDIDEIQRVRNIVKENQLSNPNLVTNKDCLDYLTRRGKGWVAQTNKQKLIGFAIVDLVDNNVWALFMDPDFEQKGIGSILHNTMLNWYFDQTHTTIWLSTDKNTRAEQFYLKKGWKIIGDYGKTEVKMEMTYLHWIKEK